METLFISDLDGTLLRNDGTLSPFTRKAIKALVKAGIAFTIATARSVKSVRKILTGVHLHLPIIEFNGAFISDLDSGSHIRTNGIDSATYEHIASYLSENDISYFVLSFDGVRDNLYYERTTNEGEQWYVDDRATNGDPRLRKTDDIDAVRGEEIVCLTIIDRYDRLVPEFKDLKSNARLEVHLQENPYSPGWHWLTLHSSDATKAKAIQTLREMLDMESHQITVFGDNTNDIKMMRIADRAIAVSNAKSEVKAVADMVIPSNEEDGVIKYIFEESGLES